MDKTLVERLERRIESTSAWMTPDLREFYTELRDALTAAQEEIARMRLAGDEIADKLWILRCDSRDQPAREAAEKAFAMWDAVIRTQERE